MRLMHRASPWRALFSEHGQLNRQAFMGPLESIFSTQSLLDVTELADAHAWQPHLVDVLVRYELPAWRISQVISDHNDWLYREAISLSLNEMQGQGWGLPPVSFCVLTLGSVARHESLLGPDQDNAMIIENYPDSRHLEIDGYFQALGERFTQRLDEAGIPLCHGHVMARWPMWRKRAHEWHEQLALWSDDRRVKRVQQTNILLDFFPVYGEQGLATRLSDSVMTLLPVAKLFLDEMAALLNELPVALDRLGRISAIHDAQAPHENALNLKRQGLMPLVSAVRLLALVYGCREISTHKRLIVLGNQCDALSTSQASTLRAGFERLQQLLLDQQRRNLKLGQMADGWVDMARLRDDQRHMLKFDLQQIKRLVSIAQEQAHRR
ncbi:DUF294 nucleotidyltransferase-like domain-containing protein [Halomonas sediminis]